MPSRPRIDATTFGSITIDGTVFEHDVVVGSGGDVTKRKKKLSKAVYGTSHTISLDEARYVFEQEPDADKLIVGSGQYGRVELSSEAAAWVDARRCSVVLVPTPEVIDVWNESEGTPVGLFHVTC